MVGIADSLLIRYVLTEGDVFLGLKRDIPSEELLALVNAQDIETLLGLMHRVHVKPHQVTCSNHPSSQLVHPAHKLRRYMSHQASFMQ